ncbi:MAG: hypothetical protein DLM61_10935 [Pseudonocardiales bacterium]|nr:MAG: hypothetical protein DLM61_10935 [Pseudonocardiales bacterium]
MNFGSHTDAVVAAAAALVNVATPGQRRGRRYDVPTGPALVEAVAGAVQTTRSRATPAPDRIPAYVDLAVAVRPVFEQAGDDRFDDASSLVNRLLARYQPVPYLDRHDDEPWHLHFHGRDTADRSGWGGGISVGLATVLGSDYADRLGVCQGSGCDRVFVDISRNGTKRFCSTACQNRVKAAAHRVRTR